MTSNPEESETERATADFLLDSHVSIVVNWLVERSGGNDARLRRDRHADEDPESFLVTFLRRRGVVDPAAEKLSQAILYVLRTMDDGHSSTPVDVTVLHICQQVYIPRTIEWFLKRLTAMADRLDQTGDALDEMIARAAVVQAHGTQNDAARRSWAKLMGSRQWATIALQGLTRTWPQKLPLLEAWWNSESPVAREKELRSLIMSATREYTNNEVITQCREQSSQWTQTFKDAIDRALASAGCDRPFRSLTACAIRNAIDGAARRPELVLEEMV